MKLVLAAALSVALTACSGSTDDGDSAAVQWDRYAPQVQKRIDRAADAGDCRKLQKEFDVADANDERQRQKYGEGNAALLDYIDAALESAGCY